MNKSSGVGEAEKLLGRQTQALARKRSQSQHRLEPGSLAWTDKSAGKIHHAIKSKRPRTDKTFIELSQNIIINKSITKRNKERQAVSEH